MLAKVLVQNKEPKRKKEKSVGKKVMRKLLKQSLFIIYQYH